MCIIMFHLNYLEVGTNLKSGINLGLSAYKKSKSHDERLLAQQNDASTDPEKKKFRRSFSQGNIFDKISGFNRLTTINNTLNNNNNMSKEKINLNKLVSNDVSISPCYKFDGRSDNLSKSSSVVDSTEKNNKTRLVEDTFITTGKSGF